MAIDADRNEIGLEKPQSSPEPQPNRGHDRWKPIKKVLSPVLRVVAGLGAFVLGVYSTDAGAVSPNEAVSSQEQGHELLFKGPSFWDHTGPRSEWVAEAPLPPNAVGPERDLKWVEDNPQNLVATTELTGKEGNVTDKLTVKKQDGKNILYKTSFDHDSKVFPEYQPVSEIPMGNVQSIVDLGKILIAGGEENHTKEDTKIVISYDSGQNWRTVNWPYGRCGGTVDLLKVSNTVVIGNNGPSDPGVMSQFIINLDLDRQTEKVVPVRWQKDGQTIDVGFASDMTIASVDTEKKKVKLVSNLSMSIQQGINVFDLDYKTGEGTMENISSVMINGSKVGLDQLRGRGVYVDDKGNLHLKTSNSIMSYLYDINLVDKTAARLDYANLLDTKGIPNYLPGSLHIYHVDVYIDPKGNLLTKLVGGYGLSGNTQAVLVDLETTDFINLMPNKHSGGRSLRRMKINGRNVYEVNIAEYALATVVEGEKTARYVVGGLENTTVPPQTTSSKVFLPNIQKSS